MASYRSFYDALGEAQAAVGGDVALLPSALTMAAVAVLPVDGASLGLMAGPLRTPLGASDADSAHAERAQSTVGDGPCLEAVRYGVVIDASADRLRRRWPAVAQIWLNETRVRSAVSIPVPVARDVSCALDLYFADQHGGGAIGLVETTSVVRSIARQLQRGDTLGPGDTADIDVARAPEPVRLESWLRTPAPARVRQQVWVAVGAVMAAAGLTAGDALDRLRAHAFATEQTLDALAQHVVDELPDPPSWA